MNNEFQGRSYSRRGHASPGWTSPREWAKHGAQSRDPGYHSLRLELQLTL